MPFLKRKSDTFTSNFRSSSLVTRYLTLPDMAVSRITLSSLSRQSSKVPAGKTCSDFSSISIMGSFISSSVIPYLFLILGGLKTSTNSSNIGPETTDWKRFFLKSFNIFAGKPCGLRSAEIQILVSITALTAMFYFSCFLNGLGNIGLNFI